MVSTLDFHHSVRKDQPPSAFMLDHFSAHRITRRLSTHSEGNGRILTLMYIRLAIYPVNIFTVARIHAAVSCIFIRRKQVL